MCALWQHCPGWLYRESRWCRCQRLGVRGPARIFHSQDDACDAILNNRVTAGDVVVVRYEGPKGGPGMQEMLYPTSYIKARGLGKPAPSLPMGVLVAARPA